MAIYKANELDFTNKKISVLIYGVPSIGKTTLALSAPRPLLIDLDKGIARVEAQYRKDTLIADTFEEMKNDLETSDLSNYDSIIIDTAGALLELEKAYVMKKEQKNATKTGSLTLAGYGAIAKEFKDFTEFVKGLGKHIIYIFHADEQHDGDETKYRLSAEGSTKTKIWESIDLGGFMEITGKERNINFSANSRSFAKGNHEINGSYKIPVLKEGTPNTFLTDLITAYLKALNETTNVLNAEQKKYDTAMQFATVIENSTDANVTFEELKKLDHALTSKRELFELLNAKAKTLGTTFSMKAKEFIPIKAKEE